MPTDNKNTKISHTQIQYTKLYSIHTRILFFQFLSHKKKTPPSTIKKKTSINIQTRRMAYRGSMIQGSPDHGRSNWDSDKKGMTSLSLSPRRS